MKTIFFPTFRPPDSNLAHLAHLANMVNLQLGNISGIEKGDRFAWAWGVSEGTDQALLSGRHRFG